MYFPRLRGFLPFFVFLLFVPLFFFSCTSTRIKEDENRGKEKIEEGKGKEKGKEKEVKIKERPPAADSGGEEIIVLPLAKLTKEKDRMFWCLKGFDIQGNPSYVFIQGTIHVGDDRLYPLSPGVLEAFLTCDNFLAELSDTDNANFALALQDLTATSFTRAEGRTVTKKLTVNQKQMLYDILGADRVNFLTLLEPWSMIMALATVPLRQGLSADNSLDSYFYTRAKVLGKSVSGLDSLQEQLGHVNRGTYEEQLQDLRELLNVIIKDGKDLYFENMGKAVENLYEAYLKDDLDSFSKLTSPDDRNEKWAEKILSYLNKGGRTFVFAGAGHFTGQGSVFSFMQIETIRSNSSP